LTALDFFPTLQPFNDLMNAALRAAVIQEWRGLPEKKA